MVFSTESQSVNRDTTRKMKAIIFVSFICVCVATVLTILCIIAGYRSNLMEGYELVTFNTSLLGKSLVEAAAQQRVAERLNIHDFYKIHILDYCEGYYEPGPVPNGSFTNPSQNITFCSLPQPYSFFNITQILQDELLPGVSLSEINFP